MRAGPAETKDPASLWRGIEVALLGMAVLSGVVLGLVPFHAAPRRPKDAPAVECGRPLGALRSSDPGPGLRAFLRSPSSSPPRRASSLDPVKRPPSVGAGFQLFVEAAAVANRYHTCHRRAAGRLGIAGLLVVGGAVPLTLRRYRPTRRPATSDDVTPSLSRFGY